MNRNDARAARMAGYIGGSAVLGLVCGFLLGRHLSMARFEERVAAEVSSVKSHYRSLVNAAAKGNNPATARAAVESDELGSAADGRDAEDDESPVDPRDGAGAGRRYPYNAVRRAKDTAASVELGEELEVDGDEADPGLDVLGGAEGEARTDEAGTRSNIFDSRDTSRPYPITLAEFSEENSDWEKLTITFYEGDKVLVDDKELPIREILKTIGPDGLDFGLGSDDPNIVYIRNERLEVDFEVTRDLRSYSEVVLGYGNPRLTARAAQGTL